MKVTQTRKIAAGLITAAVLLTTGCATGQGQYESTAYKQQQHNSRMAVQNFNDCREEAFIADKAASHDKRPAAYLQSARIMDSCLAEISPFSGSVSEEEIMRSHALMIQNYLKAGDVTEAIKQLDQFRSLYRGKDLYFADRSSFIDSMGLLLGQHNAFAARDNSRLNVSPRIKAEYRRIDHWVNN